MNPSSFPGAAASTLPPADNEPTQVMKAVEQLKELNGQGTITRTAAKRARLLDTLDGLERALGECVRGAETIEADKPITKNDKQAIVTAMRELHARAADAVGMVK